MNTERMAAIIADPTAMAELRRCTSLRELVLCLNKDGADCTREECLRFLRAWEKLEDDSEVIAQTDTAADSRGIVSRIRSVFTRGPINNARKSPARKPIQLTAERLLQQMNCSDKETED